MKKLDNRLVCSEEKKNILRTTRNETRIRRANQIVKVYECKIVEKRLNKKQKEQLELIFLEGKWFYNAVLSYKKENEVKLRTINSKNFKSVIRFDKDKNKIETELKVLSSQQKQGIITRMIANEMTISTLVKRGFQKFGGLKFKSEVNCIPLKQYGNSYKFKSVNKVKIQGISGDVLVRGQKQLEFVDEFANANLIKKPDGYYLKITCYINKTKTTKKEEHNNKEIGLDLGIKTSVTTSEGEKIDISIQESDRLKKLQREMFRRVKGSKNRYKTIQKIRRAYQKQTQRKTDKANKIVSQLKKYKTIYIQDENIKGWHKGLFGKQVQNSCLGTIKSKILQLDNVIVLDRFIPTTKFCPKCYSINNDIKLSDRIYKCSCGYSEDRDIHSAQNMITISKLCQKENNGFLPMEHREVTLTEFKTSVFNQISP